MYARGVSVTDSATLERQKTARSPQTRRRRSATGPGRERGLAAIHEQGQAVADYWKLLKVRNR